MKIIFLDIDGVLNGYNKFTCVIYNIAKQLHLLSLLRKHHDIFGVHETKVKRLSKIVKKTGAKIVISSSWRYAWARRNDKDTTNDIKKLERLFNKYNIEVIGITGTIPSELTSSHRELEIKKWLDDNKELGIESFVVLDDEQFDLQRFIGKELVQTSDSTYIKGEWNENTGLKRKHVKQAIKILNTIR